MPCTTKTFSQCAIMTEFLLTDGYRFPFWAGRLMHRQPMNLPWKSQVFFTNLPLCFLIKKKNSHILTYIFLLPKACLDRHHSLCRSFRWMCAGTTPKSDYIKFHCPISCGFCNPNTYIVTGKEESLQSILARMTWKEYRQRKSRRGWAKNTGETVIYKCAIL